ncbi:lytic transglycosylase domain-containing protein [Kineococcus sp. SYSU DK001]|uniref:lytic transglycosylase domain-containing protein n=1 Tax=Kineococcus sp. SYSU DK001 TaxID=3383122 RepID=UPI003D7E9B47
MTPRTRRRPTTAGRLGRVLLPALAPLVAATLLAPPASAEPVAPSATPSVTPSVTPSAGARTAAQARDEAAAAAVSVRAAVEQVQAAQRELGRSRAAVGSAVSASVQAQVEADRAGAAAQRSQALATQRVRSMYMDAGTDGARRGLALLSSAVAGGDPALTARVFSAVRRVDRVRVSSGREAARVSRERSEQADAGAAQAVASVRDVAAQVDRAQGALASAREQVAALEGEAARLQAEQDAAAAARLAAELAAAQAQAQAVSASVAGRAAGVHARAVPADYADLYVRAAATCAGMRPALLAAVGQVESGHGVNTGPSSAGAVGPMQFMPSTFAAYGVDGGGDGQVSAADPADAVFSAARYLCANGAGQGREAEAAAVFRYNHADWYVAMVQRVADELAGQGFGG